MVQIGDVLLFHATGGRVESGADAVDLLPPLLSAVVGTDGTVLAPAGAPNIVLVRVGHPGQARLELVTGDPWHGAQPTTIDVTVEP